MNKKQKKMLARIIVAFVLLVALHFVPVEGALRFCCYMVPYLIVGYDILLKAAKGIKNRQMFDECFLMAVATVGAVALALYSGSGDYTEAVAVMLFYQIGELFQSVAVGKSRRNISELMDISPDYANIEVDGQLEQVDPDEVEIGSIIIVQPGEKVPIDGVVLEGTSSLDTSALTGESVPRDIAQGEEVISGCINMTGVLKIRTTKEFGESTVSKILELVENASSRKSKSENFISKFARVYTPAVCYAALVLAFLPPLVRMLALGVDADWGTWIYRALTFLVISCPCALVISIPLSFFAGIGGASNAGVLVKGSNYLETLSQVRTVVFDKTGTLTRGVFEVVDIHHSEMEREKLLDLAAHAESASSHPIAGSLQRAYGKSIDRSRVTNIQEISGGGVIAHVDGVAVACGNDKLMAKLGVEAVPCHSIGTIVHVAVNGTYAGHIVVADVEKPHAKEAIAALKRAGVKKTVMLTGDRQGVAEKVAANLGVDEVHAELLPADKVDAVEALLAGKPEKEKLAFVGDGINDAPVLRRADVGIAMGAMGSDAAIEAADIVLMDDDPLKIAKAIKISRKTLRIVYQNIVFAIGIKGICLVLGAVGLANMWLAIFADVGVMVIAVINAIRALFVKNL
jgi:Cd2+/Zn2+-exporting ATPase